MRSFLGRDPVGAVADDRPVAARRRVALRRLGDRGPPREHLAASRREARAAPSSSSWPALAGRRAPSTSAIAQREQEAGRDLRVERLGRRDAHLDVAAVGRVEHAVGLVDEVAVAAVDDRRSPPRRVRAARSTVRLVSVVVPDWLIGDDERVAHVGAQAEAGELGRR